MLKRITWHEADKRGKIGMIRAVYEPGMSASDIASRIGGIKRNAIIGIYTRCPELKIDCPLGGRANGAHRRRPKKLSKPKVPRKISARVASPPRDDADEEYEFELPRRPRVETRELAQPDPLKLTMAKLGTGQCKFAVNDATPGETHLFCGAPADGSWCDFHRAIVFGKTAAINETDPALAA